MFFKKKKKFMVIGIDGVPYELIKDFAQKGIMPHIKGLIERYGLKKTRAPLPEISSVSWTSFMTGMNPGGHGIYGFMEIDRSNYSYTFPFFPSLPVKTVWEVIGDQKMRSIIINLPNTYPVRPMKGILVSGFVVPDLRRAVYPPHLFPLLKRMGYQVDVDSTKAKEKSGKKIFLNALHDTLEIRYHFYQGIEKKEKWDLLFFIITGTDRLHHFLFNAKDNPGSPYYQEFLDYYRHVDKIIGEMTADMENRGIPFIILSDHGFVKVKKEVYLSQYLKEWGYLHLEGDSEGEGKKPGRLENITGRTKIFALDPSRLYVHLEGKYKRGKVRTIDYEKLREEIKEKFLELEIEGEKVIKDVFYKEEIYNGPFIENAPDLVLLSNHGFDLKSGGTKRSHYGKTHFEGMHSQDNAMLIDSYGFALKNHPTIYEIGKKLQEYLIR
jgi:predicted AlkP superfamily phosphohydrolase/phosphomutase